MKVNVYELKRPKLKGSETRTFVDEASKTEFSFTLRGLSTTEQFAAVDYAQTLMAQYLGSETTPAKEKLPAVDGKIPKASASLCMVAGSIVFAQSGEDEDQYTFEEMVAIAETCPDVFAQLQKWYEGLDKPDPKV